MTKINDILSKIGADTGTDKKVSIGQRIKNGVGAVKSHVREMYLPHRETAKKLNKHFADNPSHHKLVKAVKPTFSLYKGPERVGKNLVKLYHSGDISPDVKGHIGNLLQTYYGISAESLKEGQTPESIKFVGDKKLSDLRKDVYNFVVSSAGVPEKDKEHAILMVHHGVVGNSPYNKVKYYLTSEGALGTILGAIAHRATKDSSTAKRILATTGAYMIGAMALSPYGRTKAVNLWKEYRDKGSDMNFTQFAKEAGKMAGVHLLSGLAVAGTMEVLGRAIKAARRAIAR